MSLLPRSQCARITILVLALIARLCLGLGPEELVLCVHTNGSVEVESVNALCCEKPSCASTRLPSAIASESESDTDDCQDFVFATGEAVVHSAPTSVESLTAVALLALPRLALQVDTCVPFEKATFTVGSRGDPPPLDATRSLALRC